MERYTTYIITILILGGVVFVFFTCEYFRETRSDLGVHVPVESVRDHREDEKSTVTISVDDVIYPDIPLVRYKERITKKVFGMFITPENSPVTPERFSGYHTGVDFEVFDGEKENDVIVRAICTGDVVRSQYVRGYGGVVVQACQIDDEDVRVIYGHLQPSSLATNAESLHYGEKVGALGDEMSVETDGERKHLHLGIFRGNTVDFRGYVQSESELGQWIDPCTVIDCAF